MRRALRPDVLWLGAIVLVAGVAASAFALELSEFVIMPDELGYVKQALELSHGNLPTPGDFWFNSWALLHSALLAPFYRWLSTPDAFDASHVLGAFVMSSAAIPAYLIVRRVSDWSPAALLVAAATVAVPWLGMAGTMMTEVVAYPAFLLCCLAMLHGIARPGWRGDVLVAVAIGLAFFARTQLLILGPAYVIALVLDVVVRPGAEPLRARIGAALRTHAPLVVAVVVGSAIVLATGSIRRVLGNYSDPTEGALFPAGSADATRELVVYVVVAAGALPLAVAGGWALLALWRSERREEHALAALVLGIVPLLAVIGGSFTVRFAAGINDRYFFYVVPLLLAGTAAALARPQRRLPIAIAAAGVPTVWLIASARIAQEGPSLVSPSMAWHVWLSDRADALGMAMPDMVALGTAIAIAATALAVWKLAPRRTLVVVLGALLAWGVVQTAYTFDKIAATQEGVSREFLDQRGWIDRALPAQSRTIAVLASLGDPATSAATWWDTSFWNKSVDRVLTLGDGSAFEQGFHSAFRVDPATGRAPALDRYRYVVRHGGDARFGLYGSKTVAEFGGVVVLEATRPYRAEWLFSGPDADRALLPAGSSGRLRVFAPQAGAGDMRVAVTLSAQAADADVTVRGAEEERRRIPDGGRATLTVAARADARGVAEVEIHVGGGAEGAAVTLVNVARA